MEIEYESECSFESKLMTSRTSLTNEEEKKFTCNLILNNSSLCIDKSLRKQLRAQSNWIRHLKRLEELARPKKVFDVDNITKNNYDGVPLECLIPRLMILAQPKYFTPKFVKKPEEPYCLPGKIRDWEAHKKWLEIRAKPKKFPRPHRKSFRTPTTKYSETSLKKICRENSRLKKRKESVNNPPENLTVYDSTSERVLTISQPEDVAHCDCKVCDWTCGSNTSTVTRYKATDETKSQAMPKECRKVIYRTKKYKKCSLGHDFFHKNGKPKK